MAKKKPTEARELTREQRIEFAEAVFEARSIVRLCKDRCLTDEDKDLDVGNALVSAEAKLDVVCELMDEAGIS